MEAMICGAICHDILHFSVRVVAILGLRLIYRGCGLVSLISSCRVLCVEFLPEKIAVDHFFYEVQRYVKIMVGGLEANA